eukprot:14785179-Heterocapsa_arctica.AAC.1
MFLLFKHKQYTNTPKTTQTTKHQISDLLVVAIEFLAERLSFSTNSELERPMFSLEGAVPKCYRKRQMSKQSFGFI